MPPQLRIKEHDLLDLGQHEKKILSSKPKPTPSNKPRNSRVPYGWDHSKSMGNSDEVRTLWRKRSRDVHPELPSKHRQVSKDESDKLFSMVEVDAQPRQTQ